MIQEYYFNGEWYVAIPVRDLPSETESERIFTATGTDPRGRDTEEAEYTLLSWASHWLRGRHALIRAHTDNTRK